MKRLLTFALGLCLLASPASAVGLAQISGTGTGGAIASIGFNAGSSIALTTTAAIPAGSLIVAYVGSNASAFTCSDPTNGIYTSGQAIVVNGVSSVQMFYIYSTGLLSSGSTVTCSGTGVSGGLEAGVVAFSSTDSAPFDSASTSSTGTSTGSTTGPTGTLNGPCGTANCEVVIGAVFRKTSSTLTNDVNFTTIGNANSGAPMAVGFKIVSATTVLSYAPTWSGSAAWAGTIQGFKAATAGAVTVHSLGALGAGN